MKLLRLLPVIVLLLCARTTSAAERMKVGFLIDFVNGVSIPISDSDYKNFSDASFKMGVRFGIVLYVARHFGIAPEGEFDFVPINSSDNRFQNNGIDAQFYRERGLVGGRFIFPFNVGSFYLRAMVGIDHMHGSTSVTPLGVRFSTDFSSTGFTFEPGAGVQFNVVKHLVVGFATGFPVALHDFGNRTPASSQKLTTVDVDFLGVIGVRL
jgi:hypothetical protein